MTDSILAGIARTTGPKKQFLKQFLPRYEQLFMPLRDKPITLLEIGIGGYRDPLRGGGSLRMWGEFFPNGRIVGLDINHKQLEMPSNTCIHTGSQTDTVTLDSLISEHGGFDIVIDDASHVTEKTIATFEWLWSGTRLLYIVEDLHMAKAKGTREYFATVPGADFDTLNMCVVSRDPESWAEALTELDSAP